MTKATLVARVAKETGLDRDEVFRVVETLMDTIKETLREGERIELRGFGTFTVKERAPKLARNISKQESILIPARKVPAFKPSRKFTSLFHENEGKKKK